MTQSPEHRRLVRLASRMNVRARNAGAPGLVSAEDLALVLQFNDKCSYCGIGLERGRGSFDHGIPLFVGGINSPVNIVRSCYSCNRHKFTKTRDEMEAFADVMMTCRICGKVYKPRHAEWKAGRATTCSRSCAAKSRY